jgi:xanthine dehydrogenase accessory factor
MSLMDNQDLQILRTACDWLEQGHRLHWGTVTRTWGSAPRPVGSNVVLRADGQIAGSVSGGCIEDDLLALARDGRLDTRRPGFTRYGVDAQQAQRFGLPCGGTVEVLLEPVGPHTRLAELLARLDAGRSTVRTVRLDSGEVTLSDTVPGEEAVGAFSVDEHRLRAVFGPPWRLIIIGAGQMSQVLADMAHALGYRVSVIDPRDEYHAAWHVTHTAIERAMPDDHLAGAALDPHTAVVALTHDPKLDDLALMEALRSPAFYVGAIGSRVNQAKRRERLREHFGLGEAELARLHGPVGLDIGARTPAEIALSIAAGITAARYGKG